MSDSPAGTVPAAKDANEDALIEAGRKCFSELGYAGARLATIVNEVGVTTGAFYRRFASKSDFFHALFVAYGDDLQAGLAESPTLREQFVTWIEISREHRGVVRASMEMLQRDQAHGMSRQRLRGLCAGLLARNLEPTLGWRDARGAALVLADVLDQQALVEALGWSEEVDADEFSRNLDELVERGLYRS
jgi:AcrR family transcriptional regulator